MEIEAITDQLTEAQRALLMVNGRIEAHPQDPGALKAVWALEDRGLVRRQSFAFGFYYEHTRLGLMRHYVASAPMRRWLSVCAAALVIVCGAVPANALGGGIAGFGSMHDQSATIGNPATKDIAELGFSTLAKGVLIFADALDIEAHFPSKNVLHRQFVVAGEQLVGATDVMAGADWRGISIHDGQEGVILFQRIFVSKTLAHESDLIGRCLASICEARGENKFNTVIQRLNLTSPNGHVGPELALGGVTGNPVGMKGHAYGSQNTKKTESPEPSGKRCPPGGIRGCVRRFPLGAQIGISLIVASLAWFCFMRALRIFGLLVITRRDALQSVCAMLLGILLFWLSFRVWMMGG